MAEQQVQRWEANDYSGVGLDRLQGIADALGVQIQETITYSSAALRLKVDYPSQRRAFRP